MKLEPVILDGKRGSVAVGVDATTLPHQKALRPNESGVVHLVAPTGRDRSQRQAHALTRQ